MVHDPWWAGWLDAMEYEINPYNAEMIARLDKFNPRFTLLYGGERSGKSYTSVAIVGRKLQPNRYPAKRLYWIVGPDYRQTRAEFGYLHQIYDRLGLVTKASMPEAPTSAWSMELSTNERWETRSSAEVAKLASFSIHGALIVEANQQSTLVWPKIRGRLMENRGWCVLSGTYENMSEWFVELYEKWSAPNKEGGISFSLPTWANSKAFYDPADPEHSYEDHPEIVSVRESMPEGWFLERYAGVPQKPSNLVVPEFDWNVHVGQYEVDPEIPVQLAIDPGKRCYCVAFVQKIGREHVRVLDCIYKRNWIAQTVIPEVMKHPLWEHVIAWPGPHGAIDVAGFAEPGTVSQAAIWQKMAKVTLHGERYPVDVTIDTLRYALASKQLFFNNLGNESFNGIALEPLAEFRLWRWKEEIPGSSEPREPILQNDHFTKAIMYWWLWQIGPANIEDTKKFKRHGAHRWGKNVRQRRDSRRDTGARRGENPVQVARRKMGERLRAQVLVKARRGAGRSWRKTRVGHH